VGGSGLDLRSVFVSELDDLSGEPIGNPDSFFEGRIRVRLTQDSETVPESDVVAHVAGLMTEGVPTGFTISSGGPGPSVVVHVPPGGLLDCSRNLRKPLLSEGLVDLSGRAWRERRGIREMITVVGSVGGVQIHSQVGVIFGIETDKSLRLWCIELHLIPVEIQAHGVRSLPHSLHRPMLSAAVCRAHPLVAIGVVEGSDEKDH